MLSDPAHDVFFSAAAIWEIAIKRGLGRVDFRIEPEEALDEAERAGFAEMPVRGRTALLVAKLPMHHRDPFDRLFVVQAMENGLTLLTADAWMTRYAPLVTLIP
jgi:PIN domain nuclease of toxin-antitoxin system